MSTIESFSEVGRLAMLGDNVAIAIQSMQKGTVIRYQGQEFTLNHTVLEGHRFAVRSIASGEKLLSWELPFGIALHAILPGEYVVNQNVLNELRMRSLDMDLPDAPNFADQLTPYFLDKSVFKPATERIIYEKSRTFQGYKRGPERGVGTRNYIVLLGTTSLTGSFVKQLASRLQHESHSFVNIDGIVPAAHTEGASSNPNNLELLLRTLAGWIVNPNVAAVLVVDNGTGTVTNEMIQDYIYKHRYPIQDVLHRFITISQGSFEEQLTYSELIVRQWLPEVNALQRTSESISHLKIGLQCGGSDAFSGISANPLLGWISEELIRYGGAANLAETDELIGAEPYVLSKVRDIETAHKFLAIIERFRTLVAWHGANAEGNPSGGNKYRGLYNIYLKSIGAARKKDPSTRLDFAINYGERMMEPGFYFMDSPGNDLESIAGQIAAGCNLIYFATGNGSITNFPYVPTIKVVTTTKRFQLLNQEMDVNAGKYLEGVSMEDLGTQTFEFTLQVASGQSTAGEKAGHSQVQIWRNWQQTDGKRLSEFSGKPALDGKPIPIHTYDFSRSMQFKMAAYANGQRSGQVGLIMPTSLCSSQIALAIAQQLNSKGLTDPNQLTRFVALPHTEGCGSSGFGFDEMYNRTMVGYITHPLVKHCLLLEHGCEKTHNGYLREQIKLRGGNPDLLGYASIQLDGGIDKVSEKVERWFIDKISSSEQTVMRTVGLEALRLGVMIDGQHSSTTMEQLAIFIQTIVRAGGLVVVPENSGVWSETSFTSPLLSKSEFKPSVAYGEQVHIHGFHMMEAPTTHWVETTTGLAATGVELIIALVNRPMQTHPLVPMLQITSEHLTANGDVQDLDLLLTGDPIHWPEMILDRCKEVIEHTYTPRLYAQGNIDFQFTRGLLGVSL
jgi:altronate dehydratase